MRKFIDQMDRVVWVPEQPQRIISLVPSQTELLYDLGLGDEVVGQTLFCIHPEAMHRSKPRVGGTKNLKMDVIASLKPDLIIGNKEENEQHQMMELMNHYPVWMSDIKNLAEAKHMILEIGKLVHKVPKSQDILDEIEVALTQVRSDEKTRTLYLIWKGPWMAAGADTFINDLLKWRGMQNVVTGRYPELTEDSIAQLNPERILLSSEPFPFKEKHIEMLRAVCPNADIRLTDGELFSWYGSRLRKVADLKI